jgi:hypothetical protein
MQVAVKMLDGTTQVLNAESISVTVGGAPVELCLMGTPEMLCIYSLNDEKDSYHFLIRPTAENSVLLQSRRSDTYRTPAAG